MGGPPPGPVQSHPHGSAPTPGWAPAALGSQSDPGGTSGPPEGRRPTDPFGRADPQAVHIEDFAPPKSKAPLIVSLAVGVALALFLLASALGPGLLANVPRATQTPPSTAAASESGLPFTSPDERFNGRWEILDHRWTEHGLMVQVRIKVDRGPLGYTFMAFENQGTEVIDPSPGADSPVLSGRRIPSGGEETGWVYFSMDRGDATIILANEAGRQMSALVVQG